MNSKYLTTVHAMIEQDLATSRQLLALLERETDSTQARDYKAMSELLKEKTPLLDGLKKNAQMRSKLLLSSNQAANEKNWSLLLDSFNNDSVKQTWQEVKTTIEHCKSINNVNGKLINRGIQSHNKLLHLMRGNTLQADIYDAKGTKRSNNYSGMLTQA
jgi:flagella synthesis protein FlgN